MNRLSSILPFALFAVAAGGGTAWFDAGVSALEDWPSDGSDRPVLGVGTWHGTEFAELDVSNRVLHVMAPTGSELSFEPRSARDFAAGDANVRAEMTFTPMDELQEEAPADAKAAILVARPDQGEPFRFHVAAKDPAGTTRTARGAPRRAARRSHSISRASSRGFT